MVRSPESRSKLKLSILGPVVSEVNSLTCLPGGGRAARLLSARSLSVSAASERKVLLMLVASAIMDLILLRS